MKYLLKLYIRFFLPALFALLVACGGTKDWDFLVPNMPDNFSIDQNKDNLLSYKVDLSGKSKEEWDNEVRKILKQSGFKPATSWEHLKEEGNGYKLGYFTNAVKGGYLEDEGGFGKFTPSDTKYYKDDIALEVKKLQKENDDYYLHIRKFPRPSITFDMEEKAREIRRTLINGKYDCTDYYYTNKSVNDDPGVRGMCQVFIDSYTIDFDTDGTFSTTLILFGEQAGDGGEWSLSEDTRKLHFRSYQGEKKIEGVQNIVLLSEDKIVFKDFDNANREYVMVMKKI